MPQAILFIPDISGYTQFISRTEVDHQQHIITELLDILIDSNDIGLSLAEVEGDALFYYKTAPFPSGEDILKLVKKMFLRFHSHLLHYEHNRICHCGACEGATGLNLKFVIHKGEITFLKLKGQKSKPHGKEVITVHRLLKNNIESDEYLLMTDAVTCITNEDMISAFEVNRISQSTQDYGIKDIGIIDFTFVDLNSLRRYMEQPEVFDAGYMIRDPIVVTSAINLRPMDLFEIMINFEHRLKWSEGLDDLNYNPKEMNKAGTRHICIISDKELQVDTLRVDLGNEKWAFGERSKAPFVGELYLYYIITPLEGNSMLRIEAHPDPQNLSGKFFLPFFKWRFKPLLNKVAVKLKSYAESPEVSDYFNQHNNASTNSKEAL